MTFQGLLDILSKTLNFTIYIFLFIVMILSLFRLKSLSKKAVLIENFATPRSLEDIGISGQVFAQWISTNLRLIIDTAFINAEIREYSLSNRLPEINIKGAGITANLNSFIYLLKTTLKIKDRKVNGELIASSSKITAFLRVNDRELEAINRPIQQNNELSVSRKIALKIAESIMKSFNPVILGYYYYRNGDHENVIKISDHILDTPLFLKDKKWAYLLMAMVEGDEGRFDSEILYHEKALEIDKDFLWPHLNVSYAYAGLGNIQMASEHLQIAEGRIKKKDKFQFGYFHWFHAASYGFQYLQSNKAEMFSHMTKHYNLALNLSPDLEKLDKFPPFNSPKIPLENVREK